MCHAFHIFISNHFHAFYREGLKILSKKLVLKLCKQAGYSPKKREKEIIFKRYNSYTSLRSDGSRKHVYV
jgi:hypothetical protein